MMGTVDVEPSTKTTWRIQWEVNSPIGPQKGKWVAHDKVFYDFDHAEEWYEHLTRKRHPRGRQRVRAVTMKRRVITDSGWMEV